MKQHYYAVRPINHYGQNHRIERADHPYRAYELAFGRDAWGKGKGFQWKDLGTRVAVIQSDKKRIALLTSDEGWQNF